VPALVFVPSGNTPRAGLIVQHGLPSRKEDLAHDAAELARLGAVVIAIDAPFARRSGEPLAFTRRDRDDQIQLIVDLRRAVDLLRSRADVDPDRIGYLGVSYGGAMGGLLAGAEPRIAAFVLMVGDGGLVEHFTGPESQGGPLASLEPTRRKEWLAAMRPIEPLAWIRRASAPLLFLSGRHDQAVPPRDAARYQRVAPEPKQIRWYDSDHFLPPRAWCDAARFLGRHIGIDGNRHSSC
jgi:dienelactone hydrolase